MASDRTREAALDGSSAASEAAQDVADSYARAASVVARHPGRAARSLPVAPGVDERPNTLRPLIAPLACFRLGRALFDFDSSFVRPEVREASPRFAAQVEAHPDGLLSVFGHADPAGSDAYNKTLSGRRAAAVYGLLTRDVALWERLHASPHGSDRWGVAATKRMLATLVDPESPDGAPYFAGEVNEAPSMAFGAAVRSFQARNGLAADGVAGPRTRAALFRLYMDAICVDRSGAPFVVAPSRFVGRGRDPDGLGAYQGCGERNPVFIFSREEERRHAQGHDRAGRDAANAPNRRVMVFLFRPGAPEDAAGWPCPRANETDAACAAMAWPDGDRRRSPGEAPREYRVDRDTMACSFYDRLARRSPCEGVSTIPVFYVRLFDTWGHVVRDAPYEVSTPGFVQHGVAEDGLVVVRNARAPSTCTVRWSRPEEERRRFALDPDEPLDPYEYELEVSVDLDAAEGEEDAARRMLDNLGYSAEPSLAAKVRAFQRDLGHEPTGELAGVSDELAARHSAMAPVQHGKPIVPEEDA